MPCGYISQYNTIKTNSLFERCGSTSGYNSSLEKINCYETFRASRGFPENIRCVVAKGESDPAGERVCNVMRN